MSEGVNGPLERRLLGEAENVRLAGMDRTARLLEAAAGVAVEARGLLRALDAMRGGDWSIAVRTKAKCLRGSLAQFDREGGASSD